MIDVEAIKGAVPIEAVIGEDTELQQRPRGHYVRGIEHDSLVVDIRRQYYVWNSHNEQGDVIGWLEKHRGMDFKGAVAYLARRAGMPEPQWNEAMGQAAIAARKRGDTLTVACRYWVGRLLASEAALAYCRGRGWTDETINQAGLGYVDDRDGLRRELLLHGVDVAAPAAKAVLAAPKGMLVYPCAMGGRVRYFACRSIEGKRHWNPPAELAGERQALFNAEWSSMAEMVVVVEGQADAVTLAQWEIAAVALGGMSISEALVKLLRRHRLLVVGLDVGAETAREAVCDLLGPLTRVATWPEKDANDWLRAGASAAECQTLIDAAPTWVEVVARGVPGEDGLEREAWMRRAMSLVARMDEMSLAMKRPGIVQSLGVDLRQFNALVKAAKGEHAAAAATNGDGSGPLYEIEMVGGLVGDHLLEMVVVPPEDERNTDSAMGWRTRFACRFPDGSIREIPYLDIKSVRYKPVSAMERILTERVVLFPSALGERMSLAELVRQIQGLIRKYVDVERFYEGLAAYYVLFSWLYDAFNTVAYLRMLGDTGTGKSRFIQVVGAMCFRPMFVTGAATTSPIFRLLDRFRGTLVLDEGDYRASDETADIIKILNTGYQRTQGIVLRSGDGQSGFQTEVFVVYGPKLIATRKRFADAALENRCLTQETGGPSTRLDIPIDIPRGFWTTETMAIRNALLRYRMEFWQPEIELNYRDMDLSMEKRLNQVTVALQTIIDDEELRKGLRAFIQEYNRQLVVERGMTLTAKVLEGLCGCWFGDLYNDLVPDVRMKRVAQAVNLLIDRENEEGLVDEAVTKEFDHEGRPHKGGKGKGEEGPKVTPRKVGQIIRQQLHMRTERSSEHGRAFVVLWDQERVEALRKRFGLTEEWLVEVIDGLKPLREGRVAEGVEQLALETE